MHNSRCAAGLLLFLAGCYDAPRTNPFDPALTPAVELQVALDDTAGRATLTWTRYEGKQPFKEYQVLRKVPGLEKVDTLWHISAVEQTTFVDSSLAPNTAYGYRIAVVNTGGYDPPSEEQRITGYSVDPVSLVEVEVEAHQGQAQLRWTRFIGARFQGYRVERRNAGEDSFAVVQQIAGLSDTSWVDEDLAPETFYVYQIVVEAAGQDWPSAPSSRQGFDLAPVQLSVETNKASGRAQLRWTQFQGPDFQGYRVERRSEEEADFGMIGRATEVADTAFTDTTLVPEVSYFYRVVVVAGGKDLPSAPSGRQSFELQRVPILAQASTGGIRLNWNPFFGPAFQRRYRVQRQEVGTDAVVTITEESDQTRSDLVFTFTDTSARAGVAYAYWVVEEAAGQEVAGSSVVARFVLPKVVVSPPALFSTTASAELKWTKYSGPYFRAYRLERHTAGTTQQVLAEISDGEINSYADTGLVGNTEYFYRVVVLTTRDEEVASEEVSGSFHDLVATWPLEVEQGEYVRLYREGEGITALVAGTQRVRLVFFDSGGPLSEQVLWDYPDITIEPRAAATYLSLDGSRVLSLRSGDNLSLLHLGSEGDPVWREYPVFVDSLGTLSGEQRRMKGRIQLTGAAIYDDVLVTSKGETLFADDFGGSDQEGGWSSLIGAEVANGQMSVWSGGSAIKEEASWQDFRLEATLRLRRQASIGGIVLGDAFNPFSLSGFWLNLSNPTQTLELTWRFRGPEDSGLASDSRSFTTPFPVLPGVPFRLGLEFVEGKVSASIQSPIIWGETRDPNTPWACLAGIEEYLLLVKGAQPYRINLAEADADSIRTTVDPPPSEIRIWAREPGSPLRRIGICLPERQQVFIGLTGVSKTTGRIFWPFLPLASVTALGSEIGQDPGDNLYPLSFDGSPDGRIYVLDAGNARIQVFDSEGKYLTQWGHKGSGEGDFDFDSGRVPEDFAGSVAVDSKGYIYVADVGNRRIQKFAP